MNKLLYRSPLYWLTLAVAVGIVFIGVRFLFVPEIAARAFGILLTDNQDVAFLFVKGACDIVSGLLFMALLWSGQRRIIGSLLLIATLIPISDGAIVLSFVGWGTGSRNSLGNGFVPVAALVPASSKKQESDGRPKWHCDCGVTSKGQI